MRCSRAGVSMIPPRAFSFLHAIDRRLKQHVEVQSPSCKSKPGAHNMVPQLGLRLDPEAGALGKLEEAVLATHSRLDEPQIGVEDRMLMLVIRKLVEGRCTVQTRCVEDAHADRRMWDNPHTVLGSEAGDRHELR